MKPSSKPLSTSPGTKNFSMISFALHSVLIREEIQCPTGLCEACPLRSFRAQLTLIKMLSLLLRELDEGQEQTKGPNRGLRSSPRGQKGLRSDIILAT